MIRIGSKEVPTNIFLAPLSGCSDLSFRLIAREHGAKFCFFEMIDSNSVIRGPERRFLSVLKTMPSDNPIAAQLLGEDPSMMVRAAKKILNLGLRISFMDINAACPTKKVVKKGAGSYLLEDRRTLFCIVKKMVKSLPVPVTVKMRVGYEHRDLKEILSISKKCESLGASAIFVHGRTKSQGYMGEVDYETIKAIKENLRVPVFGIGNIFSPESASRMFNETGCDGIMVARGAMGNPWIFKDIEDYLKVGSSGPAPDIKNKGTVLKRHLAYIDKYKECGSSGKIGIMHKTAFWYLKGLTGSARMRREISLVKTYDMMIKLIDALI